MAILEIQFSALRKREPHRQTTVSRRASTRSASGDPGIARAAGERRKISARRATDFNSRGRIECVVMKHLGRWYSITEPETRSAAG
jgi:hypothetical protein